MAEEIAVFIALLKETLASNCCAIFWATRLASTSGRLISLTFICTSLFVIFFNSSRSISICSPPLPIITPGRGVLSVSRIRLGVLSIMTLDNPPFRNLASRYSLSLVSSNRIAGSLSSEYQLESQPLIIPNLSPVGLVFCPKLTSFFFCYKFILLFCHSHCDVTTMLIDPVGSTLRSRLTSSQRPAFLYTHSFHINQTIPTPPILTPLPPPHP